MRALQQTRPPAGLWVRIAAFAFDYLVIAVYLILLTTLSLVVNWIFPDILRTLFGNPLSGQITGFLVVTLPVTMYFTLLESSSWQATWGKRRKNLRVVSKNNGRLSRMRAFGRTLLKFIPWELSHACIWQIRFSAGDPSPEIALGFALVWILIALNIASLLVSRPVRPSMIGLPDPMLSSTSKWAKANLFQESVTLLLDVLFGTKSSVRGLSWGA